MQRLVLRLAATPTYWIELWLVMESSDEHGMRSPSRLQCGRRVIQLVTEIRCGSNEERCWRQAHELDASELRDPNQVKQFRETMQAMLGILNLLGSKSGPYLDSIVPLVCATIENSALGEPRLREFLFEQIQPLLSIGREHVRKHVPQIVALVRRYWQGDGSSDKVQMCCVDLLEEICRVLPDEFRYFAARQN